MGRARLGSLYKKTPNARKWSGAFTEPVSGRRVLVTLYSDKQVSRIALDRMIKDHERRAEGLEPVHADQRRRPIVEHIEDYLDHCRHENQHPRHIQVKETHLRRFVAGAAAKRIDDLTLESAAAVLREALAEGKSHRTHNCHRASLIGFMNWAVRSDRVGAHKMARLPTLDVRLDQRRRRRALTADELERLLKIARWRPVAEYGRAKIAVPTAERIGRRTWKRAPLMFEDLEPAVERGRAALAERPDVFERLDRLGRERELIYKTLVLTGLRKGELASLTVGDLRLQHRPPYAVLSARADKARRGAEIPLRPDLAGDIGQWLAEYVEVAAIAPGGHSVILPQLAPDRRLFRVPDALVLVLARDLAAAGIPRHDDRGYTVDVHALRHTFGTHLSRATLPRTAQAAMRHSDIDLTMNLYTDPRLLDVAEALNTLPRLGTLA